MIPVIPVPVFPDSGRDPVFGADLRASDFDRDVAADTLCAAVAEGRLSLAELDQRLEDVLSARTLREIAWIMSDLPSPGFAGPAQAAFRWPARPARPAARRAAPSERWALLQSLLASPAAAPAGS